MCNNTFNKDQIINHLKNSPRSALSVYKHNKEDIDKLYPNIENYSEKLWLLKENLQEAPLCFCGKPLIFYRFSDGYFKTCQNKECINKYRTLSIEKTNLEKYGVTNTTKLESVKSKMKQTYFEKTGYNHNSQNPENQNKQKQTMIKNHGTEFALQNKDILKKQQDTILEREGTLNMFNKAQKTMLLKYGVTNAMQNHTIAKKASDSQKQSKLNLYIEKLNKTNKTYLKIDPDRIYLHCNKCNNDYSINRCGMNYYLRSDSDSCPTCNYSERFRSIGEKEMYNFIQDNTNLIITPNKHFKNWEVDIYIEDLKLAIEFNGVYWHSELYKDSKYHQRKSEYLESIGINLIHIWEDDWLHKQDIVKSIILAKLNPIRVGGRKTICKKITYKVAKEFHNKYHLDGNSVAKHHYGLYLNNELISVASFGKSRYDKNIEYELIRYTIKDNYSIIGGFSKLLKEFKNDVNFKSIMSYKKLDFGTSNFYEKIGFVKEKRLSPNFYWIVDGIRFNRQNFQKHKLKDNFENKTAVQYMIDKGYYRCYDSGSDVFVLNVFKSINRIN